jgi:hypothetical protein
MSDAVVLDTSPAGILRAMRGPIVAARVAYPDVLHVEVRDSTGALWRLASQTAEFSPRNPSALVDCSIEEAWIDESTGGLRCRLSDSSLLELRPVSSQSHDDPPSWELIAPSGLLLEFGPGLRWQITSPDDDSSTSHQ